MHPGIYAASAPDRPAIVMAGSGESITYAELDERANRLASWFRSVGLQPGDHVAFCLENHPRFLPIMWGAHYAGLYYTAMSSRLTTEEMAYIVADCGAKAFVTSAYKSDQAALLVDLMPGVELRLMLDATVDGYDSYEATIAARVRIDRAVRPSTGGSGLVVGATSSPGSSATGRL